MSKVIPIADYFIRCAQGATFAYEPFRKIDPAQKTSLLLSDKEPTGFPAVEMLARDPQGRSLGYFFHEARQYNRVIDTDLIVLEKAVCDHLRLKKPVSINLNAETFFSPELFHKLNDLSTKYPQLNPAMICLEITEQGGIPHNFHPAALIALKKMRFKQALDDFNPGLPGEMERLHVFAPHIDIVKFPFDVMKELRDGSVVDAIDFEDDVRSLKLQYPHLLFVMEGIQKTDHHILPILAKAGIDFGQLTSHTDLSECSLPAITLAQPS